MPTDYDREGFPQYLLHTASKIRERWDALDSRKEADTMLEEDIAATHELRPVPNPKEDMRSDL